MIGNPWLLALLAFASVALGTLAAVMLIESLASARRRKDLVRRLASADEPVAAPGLFRDERRAPTSPVAAALARLPHLRDIGSLLEQAGLTWTVQSYLLISLGAALAMGFLVLPLSRSLPLAGLAALGATMLPYLYVKRRKQKRLARFEEQFPEAIDLLCRAIRAGHPLSAGVHMVATEAMDPVAGEFRHIFEEQRFGLPFDDALVGMADRVDLVDVRILITAILIQREVGGNLAEILDSIAQTIRARFTIRRQLRVYTAQGRLSGYVLAAMPIVIGGAIFALDPGYVMTLFHEPIGRILVGFAVVMQVIGFLWIRKIVAIEI